MNKLLVSIGLIILCCQGTWLKGQTLSKEDCGEFRMRLAQKFVQGKPADSLTLARITSEKYLKFYKELGADGKLGVQLSTLTSIDTFNLAYKELIKEQYINTFFSPFSGKLLSTGEKIKTPETGTITVINTWFTRCKPCMEEMPALNELKMKYEKDAQVKFISVAKDQKEAVIAFLKQHEFAYDVVVDDGGKILNNYCLNLFPTNIIVDGSGMIRYFEQGLADINGMQKVIEELKK
jgi:thiol-disulfide isomerase/thioredoxin